MAPGETVKIPCDVIGDPSGNMRFEWVFNTSTEWYPKQPQSIFGVTSRDRGWTRVYIECSHLDIWHGLLNDKVLNFRERMFELYFFVLFSPKKRDN